MPLHPPRRRPPRRRHHRHPSNVSRDGRINESSSSPNTSMTTTAIVRTTVPTSPIRARVPDRSIGPVLPHRRPSTMRHIRRQTTRRSGPYYTAVPNSRPSSYMRVN
jgi:hypothetical protein